MENREKEGTFDPSCMTKIYDDIYNHNFALRAFGELLNSSDLHVFSDRDLHESLTVEKDADASNLRWGLKQIIDLYLEKQERILEEYSDKYWNSDGAILERVAGCIRMIKEGAFVSEQAAYEVMDRHLPDLDRVISRDGELKGRAEELKNIFEETFKKKASAMAIIDRAEDFLKLLRTDVSLPEEDINERLRKHFNDLETVRSQGGELKKKALKLKDEIDKLYKKAR